MPLPRRSRRARSWRALPSRCLPGPPPGSRQAGSRQSIHRKVVPLDPQIRLLQRLQKPGIEVGGHNLPARPHLRAEPLGDRPPPPPTSRHHQPGPTPRARKCPVVPGSSQPSIEVSRARASCQALSSPYSALSAAAMPPPPVPHNQCSSEPTGYRTTTRATGPGDALLPHPARLASQAASPPSTHPHRQMRAPAQSSGLRVVHPARHGSRTATSATRLPPISTAALRASPKPGCRSCSVRRNAGRTPSLRSVGGLRPIRARPRSLRARFGRSEPYRETDSGAVSAGSNPAGGTRPQSGEVSV
jgi:hypothetical protein